MVVLYLDTNLLVADIEKTPFSRKVDELYEFARKNGHRLVSSELALIEVLPILRHCKYLEDCIKSSQGPMEIEWPPAATRFSEEIAEEALLRLQNWEKSNSEKGGVDILPLGEDVARISRQLAGKTSLHAEDLLHVSTAVFSGCRVYNCTAFFLSTDERLVTSAKNEGLSKTINAIYGSELRFMQVAKGTNIQTLAAEIS